jgi:hypothetical protein
MATGQHGKEDRYKNEGGAIGARIRPGENIDKEDEEDCDDLAGCRDLAEDGRDRFDCKAKSEEDKKTNGYDKILQNKKRREPYGNNTFHAQHNKSGEKHYLVSDGVEVCPQICLFTHDSGDITVEKVCYSLEDKKIQGIIKLVVINCQNKKEGNEYTKEGKEIRNVHSL